MESENRHEHEEGLFENADFAKLIKIATSEDHPQFSLQQIARFLDCNDVAEELDPFTGVPLLLPCPREGAGALLMVIGRICNAKELLIAVQEAFETLELVALSEDIDERDDEGSQNLCAPKQVVRLVQLYSQILPRLPIRKKAPSEILGPLMSELQRVVILFAGISDQQTGRELVIAVSNLTGCLIPWIRQSPEDLIVAHAILRDVVEITLEHTAAAICAGITQVAFSKQFPRFSKSSATTLQPVAAEDVVQLAMVGLSQLGFSVSDFETKPSIPSLILLAHSNSYTLGVPGLVSFLPMILTSIQSNNALDETLGLLLSSFGALRSQVPPPELPTTLIIPLTHVLASLSSSHPDPTTRHATFRLLSIVLSLTPSPARLRLLKDLISDSEGSPPQMRVAAIGLVKEAVLEALSFPPSSLESKANVFTSPLFLREVGSTIFSVQPPGLLDNSTLTLAEFIDSPEPPRLVESLGLFYVLVQRDINNRTGVRDGAFLRTLRDEVLTRLEHRIASWNQETFGDHGQERMRIDILGMWVQRTLAAIEKLLE